MRTNIELVTTEDEAFIDETLHHPPLIANNSLQLEGGDFVGET